MLYQLFKPKHMINMDWLHKYGKLYGTYTGNKPILQVADPDLIKQICVKDFHVFTDRATNSRRHPILSRHLVTETGDDWKRIRSIVTPTFSSGKMKKMYPLIRKCLQDFLDTLDVRARSGQEMDAKIAYGNYTMDVIASCAFATKTNTNVDQNSPFVVNAQKVFRPNMAKALAIGLMPTSLLKLIGIRTPIEEKANEFFFNMTRHIMKERSNSNKKYNDFIELLMNVQKSNNNNNNNKDVIINEDNDNTEAHHVNEGEEEKSIAKKVLSSADKYLTEDEILAQSWVFFVAGYETTATALTFTSYELAINPETQEKLYKEIMSAVDAKGELDYELMSRLPYLDAVISESLRLHPPSVLLIRQAAEDYKLGDTGITLYKGQQLEVPINAVHLSEEFYEKPLVFNPERFLPENRHKIKPYSYIPFGAGPRNCIGMRFALMEAKLALAQIIKNYRFVRTKQTDVPLLYNKHPFLSSAKRVVFDNWSFIYGLLAVVPLIYWYTIRNHGYWKKLGIKGPRPFPILGTTAYMTRTPRQLLAMKWQKQYGKIYGGFDGNTPLLVVTQSELIKDVLVKDFNIFIDRAKNQRNHPILSRHLVRETGDDWKRIRSIVSPTFSSGKMKKMYPTIKQCLNNFVDALEVYARESRDVNVKILYGNYTMDVIATCAFATKTNSYNEPNNPFMINAQKIFKPNIWRFVALQVLPKPILQMLNIKHLADESANQFFFGITKRIIKERSNSNKKYNDFMELLINAQKSVTNHNNNKDDIQYDESDANEAHHVNEGEEEKAVERKVLSSVDKYITEEEMMAQAWVFFVAGYETTATTLTFATYELALNPDIQEKLYDEVITAIDAKGDIDYDLLSRLPYLDAVISETLRLHPPAVVLSRLASQDYKLGNTGITIKKGQRVEIPIYAVHHSEEYYDQPFSFIPDRFLPENRHKVKPYTYIPFGAGPRNCIGMRFALMEAKLCLAQVVKRYRFVRSPQTDIPLILQNSQALNSPKRVVVGIQMR
ncbi:uncharacterized protein LOC128959081 [Oppia nitens]|uniref:uncharacterized protein LOC128959081 n=1 Tax=Oppia nitens TaxID=1686743 RepID=UPI0023DB4143|nr:uncharacterized protein LOC128959081 [Oppia nitens]